MPLQSTLDAVCERKSLPDRDEYFILLERTITVLEHENQTIRPPDSSRLSGGLVRLKTGIPTLILPDLHARMDFFKDAMAYSISEGRTVLESLESGEMQLVCLGDGFHSERRGYQRWNNALREYYHGYARHKAMDAEMRECFGLMEMVMRVKCAFRDNVHFLKGNHENILNEEGNGNHPFRKFALEGEMVKEYVLKFFDEEFIQMYSLFEKRLPLIAVGENFIASHAEPRRPYSEADLIEARFRPDVILSLTWTDNGDADADSVSGMLGMFLPSVAGAVYFGGHRPIQNGFGSRANGRYIQIHNPEMKNVTLVPSGRIFDSARDIREISRSKEK